MFTRQECQLMTEEVWMQIILTCSPITLAPALACLRATSHDDELARV